MVDRSHILILSDAGPCKGVDMDQNVGGGGGGGGLQPLKLPQSLRPCLGVGG